MLAGTEVARETSGSDYGIYAYTAREWDPEISLYYYRARYYDPKIGRFISEDPINFDGGVNFFAYVDNSPLNSADPFGMLAKPANGKWCGSTFANPKHNLRKPPPGSCDTIVVLGAAAGVAAQKKSWCDPKGKPPSADWVKKNAKAGIDGTRAWYIPSGSPCLDYCRCEHETSHLKQVKDPSGKNKTRKQLECEAYGKHKECLELCI